MSPSLPGGNITIDMEQIARRVVACEGWRWMRGMLCLTDDDGYAARILHVGPTARQSETADSYDGGGIITRGCIREGSLPDLTDPATLGCLLALVRGVVGDTGLSCIGDGLPSGETRWSVEPSKLRSHNKWVMDATKDCWSEAEALVATLEAAGAKGLHLTPGVNLPVRKPKPLEDSTFLPKRYKAQIGPRRKHHKYRYYVALVTCPGCEWSRVLGVAGWDAVTCGGCGATLLKKGGR